MAPRASIHIEWNERGKLSHTTSGAELPSPRDDKTAWLLAPSPTLLLAHQCGVMRPSHALITCGRVMDMLFRHKYMLMPINSALKSARIDFIYTAGSAVQVQFHPNHGLFASNDSIEEGVAAFINNFTRYVYSQLNEYLKLVFRTMAAAVIGHYFDFIEGQMEAGTVGQERDLWSPSFPIMSARLVAGISTEYYVPQGGRNAENEKWAEDQTEYLENQSTVLESKRNSIFMAMGIY